MPSLVESPVDSSTLPIHASAFCTVIGQCNKLDTNVYTMWTFFILDNLAPVSFIPSEFVTEMDWDVPHFHVYPEDRRVHLNPPIFPGADAGVACTQQLVMLCEQNRTRFGGCLDKWLMSEQLSFHAIRWLDSHIPIIRIPTPLRGILGVVTAGVHMNVFTMIDHQPFLWVSQRSQTTTYPGMLDQVVAGAMDAEDGCDPWNTLEHEALEEAGLVLDSQTKRVSQDGSELGSVDGPFRITFYDRKDETSGAELGHIEPGVRFIFDLEVPSTTVLQPGDDVAVGSFLLKSLHEVQTDLIRGKWKPNSGLATLDFLTRRGFIKNGSDEIIATLRKMMQRDLVLPCE